MNNGGTLAGKLDLLLMIQDVVSFIICAGIPSVWPDTRYGPIFILFIMVFGGLPTPFLMEYSFGPFETYSN